MPVDPVKGPPRPSLPAEPVLLLTPGDPAGIGPEVAVAALLRSGQDAVVVGAAEPFSTQARKQGLAVVQVDTIEPGKGVRLLVPTDQHEPVEVASIRLAVGACLDGRADALVTGPIHKGRLAARGFRHPGHTGFLGALCGTDEPVMAFVGGTLKAALVTTHLPLSQVPAAITRSRVLKVLRIAQRALALDLGIAHPQIAVCGLNPHAGEGGLLGMDELERIQPACNDARAQGIAIHGPMSAETAMRWGATGRVHMVVAMYHDQALTTLKTLDFGASVNWTLGLPIVRTSVDHGTADDIAGKGLADPGSMVAALELARRIVAQRIRLQS